MDCDQNVIFLLCDFLFFSVNSRFMVFYIAFFSFIFKLMHIMFIQPLCYTEWKNFRSLCDSFK